jgi:hypothetical protein
MELWKEMDEEKQKWPDGGIYRMVDWNGREKGPGAARERESA